MFSHVCQTGAGDKRAPGTAARSGTVRASEDLVRMHEEMVYNLAYRLLGDAEDAAGVTQHVLVAAQNSRLPIAGGSFKLHLLRMAARTCHDRMALASSQGATGPRPDAPPAQQASDQRIQAGILSVPAKERLVLVLSDVLGLNYRDLGRITGLSPQSVRSSLARGRARLRDYLFSHQ
jgi:RNA polymerase sigma-70 factor (ECF subfamily)